MIASTQTNHPLGTEPAATVPPFTVRNLEQACTRLKSFQMRITKPRINILQVLLAEQEPIAIEEIHKRIKHHACDLVTVYRCLLVFTKLGLVRRSFAINGTNLYEVQRGGDFRYRVTCKDTGRRESLSEGISKQLLQAIQNAQAELEQRGYRDISYNLEFFAVSPKAQNAVRAPASLPAPVAARIQ